MKNFNAQKFLMGVVTVVVALTVFDFGKQYVNKMRTKAPSSK